MNSQFELAASSYTAEQEDADMARSEYHLPPQAVGFPALGAVDLSDLIALADNDTFSNGNSDFLSEIIELFLRLAPRLYATAAEAVREGDGASLARTCHKLESRAAFFGARRLGRVCRKLEDLGHAQQLQRAESQLDDLEDEIDRVHVALSRYLPR